MGDDRDVWALVQEYSWLAEVCALDRGRELGYTEASRDSQKKPPRGAVRAAYGAVSRHGIEISGRVADLLSHGTDGLYLAAKRWIKDLNKSRNDPAFKKYARGAILNAMTDGGRRDESVGLTCMPDMDGQIKCWAEGCDTEYKRSLAFCPACEAPNHKTVVRPASARSFCPDRTTEKYSDGWHDGCEDWGEVVSRDDHERTPASGAERGHTEKDASRVSDRSRMRDETGDNDAKLIFAGETVQDARKLIAELGDRLTDREALVLGVLLDNVEREDPADMDKAMKEAAASAGVSVRTAYRIKKSAIAKIAANRSVEGDGESADAREPAQMMHTRTSRSRKKRSHSRLEVERAVDRFVNEMAWSSRSVDRLLLFIHCDRWPVEKERIVLAMRICEGASWTEIADATGWKPADVRRVYGHVRPILDAQIESAVDAQMTA